MNLFATMYTRLCSSRKQLPGVQLGLITLLGILAYSNSFHVPFTFDDNHSIDYFASSKISDLLLHGSARRIVDATFAMNSHIHGAWLPGYHIANLAIHLLVIVSSTEI